MPAKGESKVNWDVVLEEVRASQLSLREIARRYGISEAAIRKKMKAEGVTRDLTPEVNEEIKNRLVRRVRADNGNCEQSANHEPATREQLIDAAASRGVEVVECHRDDVSRLRQLEQKLLAEIYDSPTKTQAWCYQGEVILKEIPITATERCQALNNLANTYHKRIQLERQAYNLNDTDKGGSHETALDMLE